MGKIIEQNIFGVMTPVDEDEWITDPAAVIAEVKHNREVLRLDENDTSVEAEQILAENVLDPEDDMGVEVDPA